MFAQRQVQQRQVQQRQVQQRQVQQRQVQQRQVQQQQKVQQQKVQQQKVQQQQQGYDNIDIAKLAIVRMSNGAGVQRSFWRLVSSSSSSSSSAGKDGLLVLPNLTERQIRDLVDLWPASCEALPESAPLPGVVVAASSRTLSLPLSLPLSPSPNYTTTVMMDWVTQTLCPSPGLGFCPYTESSRVSASGLTGVDPAPITYVNSLSSNDNIPALMAEFYEALFDMRSKGEQHTSSMIFTAPSWDNNFESWHKRLFPVLEASILAAGLGREIGIVCFHPGYLTPAPDHLSRNPFGHLPSTKKLRSWLDEHDERFSSSMNDDELTLAASYQRKSPHAMINVLWSRQLEVAEVSEREASEP